MKEGDRAYLEVNGEMHHCTVLLKRKCVYMFVNEFGEEVAKVQLFWSTKNPDDSSLTGRPGHVTAKESMKCCEAPGCGVMYKVKAADLKRRWGKTCSKLCAAKLRELNRSKSNGR
jgi:hypothetical protein